MYQSAEVFISYSRRLPGAEPAAGAAPDELRRWRARTVAVDLLRVIEPRLAATYSVWRDEPSLTAGDELGRELDAALLSCAGAVILLDPEALDRSSWVWWETTILTWRRRIQTSVRVVPVLIDVEPEELDAHEYGPSRVGDLLALKVAAGRLEPGSAGYEADLGIVADKVVDALAGLERNVAGPIGRWMSTVAACLPADNARWQPFLVDALKPHGARLTLARDPAAVVARELLCADRARFERILVAFTGFPFTAAAQLRTNLEPVWVAPDVATKVAAVMQLPPGRRIVAMNAAEPKTGAHVVRRGLPAVSPRQRVELTPTAATVEAAVADSIAEIEQKWYPSPDQAAEDLGACFVLLSCGTVPFDDLTRVAAALAQRYPKLTYVLMAGDAAIGDVERLEPALPTDADGRAHHFENVLRELVLAS